MAVIMGPVLSFKGQDKDAKTWNVSALIVSDGDPGMVKFSTNGGEAEPASGKTLLKQHKGREVWRFDMPVKQSKKPQTVQYMLPEPDQKWEFQVPGIGDNPTIAYASCNGFSDPKYIKSVANKNALWKDLCDKHASKDDGESGHAGPFHLLIMGGDQVYADSIWQEKECPPMYEWVNQSSDERKNADFTLEMRAAVEDFYFSLYCSRWSQEEPKKAFSSVPSIMMWDDHDIFDGWGSYPDDLQKCPVYRGIFEIAREHFVLFQLQEDDKTWPGNYFQGTNGFTFTHTVGKIAIAALDLRSERTKDQVMGRDARDKFIEWLKTIKKDDGIDHLLVLSSIPVVHLDFAKLEKVLNWIPGQQELEDDLRDHWHSVPHKEERLDLIKTLLDFAKDNRVRVTCLSGDVHVAAVGAIESLRNGKQGFNENVINQLTCSAIVHPAPAAIVVWAMNTLMEEAEEIDRDINARVLKFRGTDFGLVGRRNWMSLNMRQDASFIAHWHMEKLKDGAPVYSKIVNAVPA